MSGHTSDFRIPRDNHIISVLLGRLSTWIIPALVGALLTLLFNASGDRANAAQMVLRVDKLEVQLHDIQKDLASGGPPALARRVDDLQAQTQEQYREVSKKLDQIQEILLAAKRK